MCVIIYKPANERKPSYNILEQCYIRNSDGTGFCTSDGEMHHEMSFYRFLSKFEDTDDAQAAIVHFRWATHGSIGKKNCHPFFDRKSRVFFAHNGILPIKATNDRTDSETWFRDRFLPMLAKFGWDSNRLWDWVKVEAGQSRFIFMRDNDVKRFGHWHYLNGCYYSNLNWQYSPCWPVYGDFATRK